jgi:hypothetical protein
MATFRQGQRVSVIRGHPTGPGTVHDVIGGPVDHLYRVLMDTPGETGLRIMAQASAASLLPAEAIPAYTVGQRVTYLGRGATITDVSSATVTDDPGTSAVYVLCDRDPPEMFSGVEHEYVFIMPAWKLHAYAR